MNEKYIVPILIKILLLILIIFLLVLGYSPKEIEKTDLEIIQQTAEDVAKSNKYELHVYDCTNYSIDLSNRLVDMGYNAYCVAGKNYAFDYINHTWVQVELNNEIINIEATTGDIISPEEFKTYRIWKKHYCW